MTLCAGGGQFQSWRSSGGSATLRTASCPTTPLGTPGQASALSGMRPNPRHYTLFLVGAKRQQVQIPMGASILCGRSIDRPPKESMGLAWQIWRQAESWQQHPARLARGIYAGWRDPLTGDHVQQFRPAEQRILCVTAIYGGSVGSTAEGRAGLRVLRSLRVSRESFLLL
jgi:hypothetical protein